ncbi:hypothetical protein PBRA_003755 [Plasmodiophora brassicae]|uniref:PH domain-containing protein n=1 Tax=Plasmodiophora brassicae TaxID=37360 RepID=A0A0G4IIL2_PLABS|nr:hypothetical protein PBRA_003755 [Plasmodiophora brassicae]
MVHSSRSASCFSGIQRYICVAGQPWTFPVLTSDASRQDEEVCLLALKAISNFASAQDTVSAMVEHEIPLLLIRTIKRHLTSATILEVGIMVLADASRNPHVRDLVRIHNGISAIGDTISVHKTNPKVLDAAFYCLANLTVQSPDNIASIVESGCMGAVIDGMMKFSTAPSLVEAALATLNNVCRNGITERRHVADLNACHAMVEVLKPLVGQRSIGLAKSCLVAIATFAQCPENIDVLLDANALNLICTKVMVYRTDLDLVKVGISTIAIVATSCSDATLPALLETRCLATVLVIARANPYQDAIQAAILQLFTGLYSRFSNAHSQLLSTIRLMSIPVALSSMYCFPKNAMIASAAATLLTGVLTDQQVRGRLELIDIFPTVVRVAMEQIDNHDVVRLMLNLLAELMTLNVTSSAVEGSNMLDLVGYIITQPDTNPKSLESALALLSQIVTHGDSSELAVQMLAKPLFDIASNPETSRTATYPVLAAILGDLAQTTTGAEILLQLGFIDLQLKILAEESRHPMLVSIILESLRKLMRSSLKARADLKQKGAVRMVETLRFQHSAEARVSRAANDFLRDIESTALASKARTGYAKPIASTDGFKLPELDQNVRLFLVAGGVLVKHCKRALPRKMNVFVSPDLRFLVWRDPGNQKSKPRSFFLDNSDRVVAGRATPELQRQTMFYTPAAEPLAFAVFMKDGRTLNLEAHTPALRQQWVQALREIIRYRQDLAKLTTESKDNHSGNSLKDEDSTLLGGFNEI